MKQMKLFLVALLTVVMGISVTSCMNGEDNPNVPVYGVLTLKNTFPYQFQVAGSDVVFETSAISIPGLTDAYSGDIVLLNAQYNKETQVVDQNTKKIMIDVTSAVKLNVNSSSSLNDVDYNRSVVALTSFGYNISPELYGANWIIFPVAFRAEKEETISNHMFCLVYDKENEANNDNTMVLRLRHISSGDADKEKTIATAYRAFNISNLVNAFEGSTLKTIKIIIQEQVGDSPLISTDSDKGYKENTYIIQDYDKYLK